VRPAREGDPCREPDILDDGGPRGHDAVVEDDVILVNGAALAGHTVLGRGAILSAHVAVHQFCWIGERAIGQGNSATSMHIPPFTLFAGANRVVSLNVVVCGVRRRSPKRIASK